MRKWIYQWVVLVRLYPHQKVYIKRNLLKVLDLLKTGQPTDLTAFVKTSNLIKECISQKIGFKQKYVLLSKHFLNDVESMDLHEIEMLNMKCNQVLNNEASYSDSDEEQESKETLQLKQKVPLQRPSRANRPSESHENVQNYLVGFRTSATLPQTAAICKLAVLLPRPIQSTSITAH